MPDHINSEIKIQVYMPVHSGAASHEIARHPEYEHPREGMHVDRYGHITKAKPSEDEDLYKQDKLARYVFHFFLSTSSSTSDKHSDEEDELYTMFAFSSALDNMVVLTEREKEALTGAQEIRHAEWIQITTDLNSLNESFNVNDLCTLESVRRIQKDQEPFAALEAAVTVTLWGYNNFNHASYTVCDRIHNYQKTAYKAANLLYGLLRRINVERKSHYSLTFKILNHRMFSDSDVYDNSIPDLVFAYATPYVLEDHFVHKKIPNRDIVMSAHKCIMHTKSIFNYSIGRCEDIDVAFFMRFSPYTGVARILKHEIDYLGDALTTPFIDDDGNNVALCSAFVAVYQDRRGSNMVFLHDRQSNLTTSQHDAFFDDILDKYNDLYNAVHYMGLDAFFRTGGVEKSIVHLRSYHVSDNLSQMCYVVTLGQLHDAILYTYAHAREHFRSVPTSLHEHYYRQFIHALRSPLYMARESVRMTLSLPASLLHKYIEHAKSACTLDKTFLESKFPRVTYDRQYDGVNLIKICAKAAIALTQHDQCGICEKTFNEIPMLPAELQEGNPYNNLHAELDRVLNLIYSDDEAFKGKHKDCKDFYEAGSKKHMQIQHYQGFHETPRMIVYANSALTEEDLYGHGSLDRMEAYMRKLRILGAAGVEQPTTRRDNVISNSVIKDILLYEATLSDVKGRYISIFLSKDGMRAVHPRGRHPVEFHTNELCITDFVYRVVPFLTRIPEDLYEEHKPQDEDTTTLCKDTTAKQIHEVPGRDSVSAHNNRHNTDATHSETTRTPSASTPESERGQSPRIQMSRASTPESEREPSLKTQTSRTSTPERAQASGAQEQPQSGLSPATVSSNALMLLSHSEAAHTKQITSKTSTTRPNKQRLNRLNDEFSSDDESSDEDNDAQPTTQPTAAPKIDELAVAKLHEAFQLDYNAKDFVHKLIQAIQKSSVILVSSEVPTAEQYIHHKKELAAMCIRQTPLPLCPVHSTRYLVDAPSLLLIDTDITGAGRVFVADERHSVCWSTLIEYMVSMRDKASVRRLMFINDLYNSEYKHDYLVISSVRKLIAQTRSVYHRVLKLSEYNYIDLLKRMSLTETEDAKYLDYYTDSIRNIPALTAYINTAKSNIARLLKYGDTQDNLCDIYCKLMVVSADAHREIFAKYAAGDIRDDNAAEVVGDYLGEYYHCYDLAGFVFHMRLQRIHGYDHNKHNRRTALAMFLNSQY